VVTEASEVEAKHIGHGVGVGVRLRRGSRNFGKMLSYLAQRRRDQVAGQSTGSFQGLGQHLSHEGVDRAGSRYSSLLRLGCIAIERRSIIECDTYRGLLTFRADEGMDKPAQPFKRRSLDVLEDAAEQRGRLPPFVALESEQDRRLVREILIKGSDADAGLFSHPCRGEALRPFLRQNLNSSLQNRRHEVR